MGQTEWTPKRIQMLRRILTESVAEFGERVARSGRTIEDWEQGRREPDRLALRVLDGLVKERRLARVLNEVVG